MAESLKFPRIAGNLGRYHVAQNVFLVDEKIFLAWLWLQHGLLAKITLN